MTFIQKEKLCLCHFNTILNETLSNILKQNKKKKRQFNLQNVYQDNFRNKLVFWIKLKVFFCQIFIIFF